MIPEPVILKVVNKMSGVTLHGADLGPELLKYVDKNAHEFHFYYANETNAPGIAINAEIVGFDKSPDIVGIEEEVETDTLDPKKAELMLNSKEGLLEIAKSLGVKVHHATGKDKIIDAILYGKE